MYFSISSSRSEDGNHEGGPCRQTLTTRNFHLHPKHHPASWPLGSQPWVVCSSRAVWMVAFNCGRQYALSLAEEWWWCWHWSGRLVRSNRARAASSCCCCAILTVGRSHPVKLHSLQHKIPRQAGTKEEGGDCQHQYNVVSCFVLHLGRGGGEGGEL